MGWKGRMGRQSHSAVPDFPQTWHQQLQHLRRLLPSQQHFPFLLWFPSFPSLSSVSLLLPTLPLPCSGDESCWEKPAEPPGSLPRNSSPIPACGNTQTPPARSSSAGSLPAPGQQLENSQHIWQG